MGALADYLKKESVSVCFKLALTSFISILIAFLSDMPWYILIPLVATLFVTIVCGTILVRRAIAEFQVGVSTPEIRRQLLMGEHIQEIIDEGLDGQSWDQATISAWVSKVEAAIRPVLGKEHFDGFVEVSKHNPATTEQDRLAKCVAWLKTAKASWWS